MWIPKILRGGISFLTFFAGIQTLILPLACSSQATQKFEFVTPVFSGKNSSEFANFFRTRFAKDSFKRKIEISYERLVNPTVDQIPFYLFETTDPAKIPTGLADLLERDPTIQKMLSLRKKAHAVAQSVRGSLPTLDPENETIYISISDKRLFGVGPVFVDTTNFLVIDRQPNQPPRVFKTNNLISFEEAKFFNLKIFTPAQLMGSGYLPYIAAHEMAHLLMQELYGVEALEKVLREHHSTSGHDVMLTSDAATAYVEGFAEAFEAYFYTEKKPWVLKEASPAKYDDLFAVRLFNEFGRGRSGLQRFADSISLFTGDAMGNFILRHLEDSRVLPIVKNQYLADYPMGAEIIEKSAIFHQSLDSILNESAEIVRTQTAHAREGVIAHQFYELLQDGRFERIALVMSKHRPLNYFDFYRHYLEEYPQDHEDISQTFFRSFHPAARSSQELIYGAYRKYWEFERKDVTNLKEDFVIFSARPKNANEFRDRMDHLFPHFGDFELTYDYNTYDTYIEKRIKTLTPLFAQNGFRFESLLENTESVLSEPTRFNRSHQPLGANTRRGNDSPTGKSRTESRCRLSVPIPSTD